MIKFEINCEIKKTLTTIFIELLVFFTKKLNRKAKKLKVQAAIQGDKVRVTGKKRDDLQEVIQMLRDEKLEMPLQYENFRD